MEDKNDITSIKQMFQSMVPDGPGIIEGTVTRASPLQVTLANDSMMVLGMESLVLPRHLTDYETTADITGDSVNGSLSGGTHNHSVGIHEGHMQGDGSHTHDGGGHSHKIAPLSIMGAIVAIHGALRQGEQVYLLSYNNGKKYFVLDRKD